MWHWCHCYCFTTVKCVNLHKWIDVVLLFTRCFLQLITINSSSVFIPVFVFKHHIWSRWLRLLNIIEVRWFTLNNYFWWFWILWITNLNRWTTRGQYNIWRQRMRRRTRRRVVTVICSPVMYMCRNRCTGWAKWRITILSIAVDIYIRSCRWRWITFPTCSWVIIIPIGSLRGWKRWISLLFRFPSVHWILPIHLSAPWI